MLLQVLRIYLLLLAIPAALRPASCFVSRRYHGSGLVSLVVISSVLYGFLSFRAVCSRPVTCDVGNDPSSVDYLASVAPPFALAAAIAFGVASVLVVLRSKRAADGNLRTSDFVLVTVAGVLGFVVAAPILRAPVW